MSVSFRGEPTVEIGAPVSLFRADLRPTILTAEMDVSADGQRFVVNRMLPMPPAQAITLDLHAHMRK